jgi:putative transcriptional regulator
MRLRLKADGRIVELRDGHEVPLVPDMDMPVVPEPVVLCAICAAARN